jgi:type I restriction enzyme S subunit
MPRNGLYPASVTPGIPKLGEKPDGWILTTFGEVLKVVKRKADIVNTAEYQLVTAKRSRGGIVPREKLLGKQIKTKTQFFIATNDFLISRRQIIHGACGVVPPELNGALVSNEYATLKVKKGLLLEFLDHFTHTVYFQQTCFHASVGVDVEKMVFKLEDWLKSKVHLPPLPEQRAIAAILGTWDRAIALTERRLAAAEQRKKALMQQLLTGRVRFAEFAGEEWREVKVSEMGRVVTGNTPSKEKEEFYGGCLQWASPADIEHHYEVKATKTTLSEEGRKVARIVPKGSVLVTCIGSIGKNAVAGVEMAFNQQINAVVVNRHFDNLFVYYLIDYCPEKLWRYAGTTSVAIINKSTFEKVKYYVPSSLGEQRRIATVLNACDREVDLLRRKRDALQQQKKGLMQRLLTGRVRVRHA